MNVSVIVAEQRWEELCLVTYGTVLLVLGLAGASLLIPGVVAVWLPLGDQGPRALTSWTRWVAARAGVRHG